MLESWKFSREREPMGERPTCHRNRSKEADKRKDSRGGSHWCKESGGKENQRNKECAWKPSQEDSTGEDQWI